MLLALALLALLGFWWLGRNGGRLPFGLSPQRLYSYALFAVAAALAMRGSLIPAGLLALGGLWLLEGPDALKRRFGALFGRRSPDPRSHRTATIEFELSPGGLPRDGTILAGPHTAQRLSGVTLPDLVALEGLCRDADPEGTSLLQAYLDGRQPGWRVDAERDRDPRTGAALQPGAMTEEEAYQVLGLQRGASLERIRAAHRDLMKRLHPDQGGSVERAARVNAARDRLTNRHR